jgi:hypothetical protein
LCGSTRFQREYETAQRDETLAGRIVLTVGLFGHHEGLDMDGPVKAMLDELHLAKIDLADEILVLDASRPWCLKCQAWCKRFDPTIISGDVSHCCARPTELRPYIGDSTRREIAYAERLGKPVRYLSQESAQKAP